MAKSPAQFSPEQLEATPETACDLVHQSGVDGPALVTAWISAANAGAVQSVAERGQGAARKAARRGLNVLKSRGVGIPTTAHTGNVSAAADRAARQAWLLPPDGAGIQGIVLCQREPSGRYLSCFVFFLAGQQILRAQSGPLALSKIKENMQQALGGAGYSAVSVPFAWAQHRVRERRAWHAAQGVVEPLGLLGAAPLLDGDSEQTPAHPFDEEGLALGPDDAQKLAAESQRLHQMPEFRSWLPSEAAVQDLLGRVGRRLSGQDTDDPEAIDPIVREEVAAATDRHFTPEQRAVLAERMKDSALSVLARAGERAGLEVAAVIQVIQEAGLITNPPSEVKFLSGFFDKALSLIAARQGGKLRVPIPRPPAGEGAPDDAAPDDADASEGAEAGAPETASDAAP